MLDFGSVYIFYCLHWGIVCIAKGRSLTSLTIIFLKLLPSPPVHLQYQLSQSIINNNCNSSLIYICQIYSNCYPFVQQAIVAIGLGYIAIGLFTYNCYYVSTNRIVQHDCITTGLVFQLDRKSNSCNWRHFDGANILQAIKQLHYTC